MNREPSQPPASDTTLIPESGTDRRRVPDAAALVTAMTVAPGVYARNRMFAFFKDPTVRRARDRAAMIRGLARQLAGGHGEVIVVSFDRSGPRCRLKYRVPAIRLERVVELDSQEAVCVAYLVGRAGSSVLGATEAEAAADRAAVEAALRRLSV